MHRNYNELQYKTKRQWHIQQRKKTIAKNAHFNEMQQTKTP